MVRHDLLAKIVLGLTLFVNTSVQQSLETGYEYTDGHTIGTDGLREDLKCGYLFGWYTHMRLIKLLFEQPYYTELRALVGLIRSTGDAVRSQIISLFGLRAPRIGALWAQYLFGRFVYDFYFKSKNPSEDHPKIAEALVYVIGKLGADLVGCRKGNSFDFYDNALESLRIAGPDYYNMTTVLVMLLEQVNAQLQNNAIIPDGSLQLRLEINNSIPNIFLNNLGKHGMLKTELQNVYNLRINWNNTSTALYTAWLNTRYLDWTDTNLYPIVLYYNACYAFLKIIIVRLTVKHLTYLKAYPVDSDGFLYYAQKWYNIVIQFSAMLRLSDDLHVDRLLHLVGNLIYRTQTLASVVSTLSTMLTTLCQPFGCDAGNEFVIDNREFTVSYLSLIGIQVESMDKMATPAVMGIEYNSLKNARNFLSHLKIAFSGVNFSVIRSLTEYIYELNPTKDVARSEECTEEFQNLNFDMSGYE